MLENLVNISKGELVSFAQEMFNTKHRFITTTCVDNKDGTNDLIYHFDKEKVIKNVKLTINREETIPSISGIYFCAILVENEMQELFGIKIKGIVVDYGGHLLLSDDELNSPMSNQITIIKKEGGQKNA